MYHGSALKFGVRMLCVVAAVIACACQAEPDSLAYIAKEAKQQGKKAITIRHIADEIDYGTHLDNLLRVHTTLLATPADPPTIQTIDKYGVYKWNFFRVLRILAQPRSQSNSGCDMSPPRPLSRAGDEIAIRLVAGTALIDGVAITMDTDESEATFKPSRQYLFLAMLCPDGVAILPQGRVDIFDVSADGRIAASPNPANLWFGHVQEMQNLGTIDRLTEHLKALSTGH